jgi:signal transduction histidine kinase
VTVIAAREGTAFDTTHLRGPRHRRLLELLRAAVVRQWDLEPPGTVDELLELTVAFERVRAALEPGDDQSFAERLTGPDGLALVVELAHDLRSPLTSILFLAETLQRARSGPVNDLQRRQLGLVYSAGLGLSTLVSNIMELARGGSRLEDEEPVPFSVTEALEAVKDIVHPMAEEKGLAIRLLPPSGDSRIGHPDALSRVLLNLTTNAIKFTEEGFVEITAVSNGLKTVEFGVRDTGRGIHAEALTTLYQPFRQSRDRSRYAFSGTGLGLALCRKLVGIMGSELKVETRAGWGTRFYFELELEPATQM